MWGIPLWDVRKLNLLDFFLILKLTFHFKGKGGAIDSFMLAYSHSQISLLEQYAHDFPYVWKNTKLLFQFSMCRTYVLVTSVSPLRAYFYHEGLVRFASSKYNHSEASKGNETQVLTNTSVGMTITIWDAISMYICCASEAFNLICVPFQQFLHFPFRFSFSKWFVLHVYCIIP